MYLNPCYKTPVSQNINYETAFKKSVELVSIFLEAVLKYKFKYIRNYKVKNVQAISSPMKVLIYFSRL
jgi:hypothetical protein